MALTGAYIVKLDNGSVSGVMRRACPGRPFLPGALDRPEDEVCGKRGSHDVGGIWLCLGHYKMVLRESGLHNLADEERAIRPGTCVFPAWGRSSDMPEVSLVCGNEAEVMVGTAGVCAHHLEMATKWVLDREKARKSEEAEKFERAREAEAQTWSAQGYQVVYYLRRPSDGAIKIGTTKGFAKRYRDLVKDHGELELLLTHCGDYPREREMHRKFDALLIGNEWFRPGPELMEWIVHVRRKPVNNRTRLPETVRLGVTLALLDEARKRERGQDAA